MSKRIPNASHNIDYANTFPQKITVRNVQLYFFRNRESLSSDSFVHIFHTPDPESNSCLSSGSVRHPEYAIPSFGSHAVTLVPWSATLFLFSFAVWWPYQVHRKYYNPSGSTSILTMPFRVRIMPYNPFLKYILILVPRYKNKPLKGFMRTHIILVFRTDFCYNDNIKNKPLATMFQFIFCFPFALRFFPLETWGTCLLFTF